MSAPEDRERRTSRLDRKSDEHYERGVKSLVPRKLAPYNRNERHNTHVQVAKLASTMVGQSHGNEDPDVDQDQD